MRKSSPESPRGPSNCEFENRNEEVLYWHRFVDSRPFCSIMGVIELRKIKRNIGNRKRKEETTTKTKKIREYIGQRKGTEFGRVRKEVRQREE